MQAHRHVVRRRLRARPERAHALVQHHLDLALQRGFDGRHADLAVALHRVSVADRDQCAAKMDRQEQARSGLQIVVVHVAAEHIGRAARHATHRARRRDPDDAPERLGRDDDARRELDLLLGRVDEEHAVARVGKILRQRAAVRPEAHRCDRQPQVDRADPDFDRVAHLRAAHGDRAIERVIVSALARSAFEGGVELGRDFLLRHAQAFEVARIAGGGPQPHDVARIDRQHRLERGIEKAAVHGRRRGLELMHLVFASRLHGGAHGEHAEAYRDRL